LLIGLSFVLIACSDGAEPEATATTIGPETTSAATAQEDTTSSQPSSTTTQATGTTEAGRPVAPDFTFALGDGGEFKLSEGARPVYLVFWAEW
jgi:hypothetical protein